MILISYDGSADAQAAIGSAAQLMPGAKATVVTVWEPFIETLQRSGTLGAGMGMGEMGMVGSYTDAEEIDRVNRDAALGTADEGLQRATAAGLIAQPRCEIRHGDIANTILVAATAVNADVIVVGTRGLSGVKSFLLGSVANALVHHADRPVIVVPSPALAERRHNAATSDPCP